MQTDPILREVYRIKDQLNRETGGDVGKLIERLNEFARQHPERMAKPAPKPVTPGKPRTPNRKTAK
jgi:hypothetical protein